MKVLIACEYSGTVREEFKKLGHDAWSCDILDTEIPGNHIKDDVLKKDIHRYLDENEVPLHALKNNPKFSFLTL